MEKLSSAVIRFLGPPGDILELRRLTAGATKATFFFRAKLGGLEQALILQLSNRRPRNAPEAATDTSAIPPLVAGKDDAALMIAARQAGVPAALVRAVLTEDCGLGEGYIMDYVEGETLARRILREPRFSALRESFATQCGEILAGIHALDPASLPFLARFGPERQIELYRQVYDSYGYPAPALEVAFRWAGDHLPKHLPGAGSEAVVHGDFRMGNLICGEDRIRAVLDWELACLGDPMQDLGWLCVRTWRFGGPGVVGGIGRRSDLFAAYERASEVVVDPLHVRFWEGWGCVKWAIMCLAKGQAHRQDNTQRTVEAFAIGRRMEEPLHDFLEFLHED